MPARNSIKKYKENGYYHIYNRGVDKRKIFRDKQDYVYFMYLLKTYLTNPKEQLPGLNPVSGIAQRFREKPSFDEEIDLLAYCLMPNHFHLLIRQRETDSMTRFMKCMSTNYSMYFNRKYKRVGSLFQGIYKAVNIDEDSYLLHLSRYIHLNPVLPGLNPVSGASDWEWSSYGDYVGAQKTKWVKPDFVLDMLRSGEGLFGEKYSSYEKFVEDFALDSETILGKKTIED